MGCTVIIPKPVVIVPDDMTNKAKLYLLDAFIRNVSLETMRKTLFMQIGTIKVIINILKEFDRDARLVIKGKYIEAEATYDGEGNELTPIDYNDIPANVTDFKTYMAGLYSETFTTPESNKIVDEFIKWCIWDGSGTFTFYKDN